MPFWRLFYHMTWGTQDRTPLIEAAFEDNLHNVLAAKARDLGAFVYAVGGVEDHVHVIAAVPPRISLADFVGQLKGNSSHWVNHKLLVPCHFSWQQEYGIVTFGGQQLDTVVRYCQNQHQHHRDRTLTTFLERVEAEPLDHPPAYEAVR